MAAAATALTNRFPSVLSTNAMSMKVINVPSTNFLHFSSRRGMILSSMILTQDYFFDSHNASAFDFRLTVPDQTPEEAQIGVKIHSQDLLKIKELIDLQSWREAQKELRQSSGLLKQDLYTIIQSKPGNQRPELRKMYSFLFNNVTRLDYAARSQDVVQVQERYKNIVLALQQILSKI